VAEPTPALHQHIEGAGELWQGSANGVYVALLTPDPDLVLYTRGFVTPDFCGAELVDADGQQHHFSYRCR